MSSNVAATRARGIPANRRGFGWKARKVLRRPQFWFGLLVLVPTAIWYAIFSIGPVLQGLYMAFSSYNMVEPEKTRFIGFANFITVSEHFLFPIALKNTLLYSVEFWAITFPLALATSVALVSINRWRNVFQFTIFVPVVVSMVAMALLFKQILDPDTGIVNAILRFLHLPQGRFLTDEGSALLTVAVIDAWKVLGTYMVLLTAGLLNIPQEIYDAAKVDGANSWETFWQITIPLLQHVLVLVITMLLIQGLQVFVSATILPRTPGGPGYATTVLSIWLYQEAFTNYRLGFAAAISVVLFAIVFIVTLFQMRLKPDWEY